MSAYHHTISLRLKEKAFLSKKKQVERIVGERELLQVALRPAGGDGNVEAKLQLHFTQTREECGSQGCCLERVSADKERKQPAQGNLLGLHGVFLKIAWPSTPLITCCVLSLQRQEREAASLYSHALKIPARQWSRSA